MNHWNGNPDSVMSAILTMTTPPVTDNGKGKKKNDKRVVPKETNCKGCGEPGDILLTCKSCSVCYHPLCDDPPKDEESAKDKVDWNCRTCRNKHFLPASGEGEKDDGATASAPKGTVGAGASKRVTWKDAPGASRSKGKASKKRKKQKKVVDLNDSIEKIMKTGVGTCKTANPSIFEIPIPYQRNDFVFPGTSRSVVKKASRRNIIDHDTETAPKAKALCFECHLSCRKAPLIQCDYCPSYFHFDCLTPPLTTPPGGIWMCPLHPEPFLESTRLTSSALSERIRLWNTTHQEFCPSTVVLSFMEKTQRNPLYSFRKRFPYSKMFFTPRSPGEADYSCMPHDFAEYEDTTETTINNECNADTASTSTARNKSELSSVKEMLKTDSGGHEDVSKLASSVNTELSAAEAQHSKTSQLPNDNTKDTDLEGPAPKRKCTTEPSCRGVDLLLEAAAKSNESDERRMNLLKSIPLEQVYNLAFQRLKDLDAKCAEQSGKGGCGSSQVEDKPVVISNPSQFKKKTDPMIQFYVHNTASQLDVTSTAIEIGLKEATKSYYAWLNPQKYVSCTRFSSRDLFIFFDPQKLQWEFITYSPHGVIVDSVLHSLQEPKIPVTKPREMHEFKMALFERRGLKINAFNPRYVKSNKTDCECDKIKLKYATLISHESGGILHAGSTIRIGCLRLTVKKFTIGESSINGDAA